MIKNVKYKDTTNDISHIYKQIYLSNYKNAKSISLLNAHHIGAVLYIGNRPKSPETQKLYDVNSIKHTFIHMEDTIDANISECFETAWKFITENVKHGKGEAVQQAVLKVADGKVSADGANKHRHHIAIDER